MTALILSMVLGCTSKITVNATPNNASIYITKQDYGNITLPSAAETPAVFEAKGEGSLTCNVGYLAWNKFYVYAEAPGYKTEVMHVPGEIKVLPAIGGLCLFTPIGIWAVGPDSSAINLELQQDGQVEEAKTVAPEAPAPESAEDIPPIEKKVEEESASELDELFR